MKIFTAGMLTETSDITPVSTSADQWKIERPEKKYRSGKVSIFKRMLVLFRAMAEQRGWEVAESLCATALPPGGRTIRSVYEGIRQEIIDDLKSAMPVDGVLLQLHGAAMAHGYDDCEGDLLVKIRCLLGPDIPIAVELDPHCHMTQKMMDSTTLFVMYKTFLHTDIEQRAVELFDLFVKTLEREVVPVMAVYRCGSIDFYDEAYEPMKSFLSKVFEKEKIDEVLSISPIHGFPMADIPDMGSQMLVVTDNNIHLAKELAKQLGDELYSIRGQQNQNLNVTEGLNLAKLRREQGECGIKIIDWGDHAGCGFPTDGTELAQALIANGMKRFAIGLIWDPLAVSIAIDAGEGARLHMRIGGKASPLSGNPLDLEVRVERVEKNATITTWIGEMIIGDTVVLRHQEAQLLLVSNRVLGYGLQCFRDMGVDIHHMDYLVFKYLSDSDDAISIYGSALTIKNLPFKRISRPLWPWDENVTNQHGEENATTF